MSSTHREIKAAAQLIREGKLVAMPTETVYGLGANALDPMAVSRIFESKERPSFDPLIVHICDLAMAESLVEEFDPRAQALAEAYWPGPLTLILPKSELIPDIVSSGLPTVGLRMPNHPIALELIKQSTCPIAAPSANKFGRVSPTQAKHVAKQLDMVEAILDGGGATVGIESTIVALTDEGFEVLRPGAITPEMIAETLKPLTDLKTREVQGSHNHKVEAPGMLDSHYSPNKPLYIVSKEEILQAAEGGQISLPHQGLVETKQCGLIHLDLPAELNYGQIYQPASNLSEFAIQLFSSIHYFEDSELGFILVQEIPEEGIGVAIMDRLKKAAFRFT